MPRPDWPTAAPYVPETTDVEQLRTAAPDCRGCPLWEPATQVVFGRGGAGARLMLVGEQPGDVEDTKGVPFVGPAGRLLVQALDEAGIDRSDVSTMAAAARGQTPGSWHAATPSVWAWEDLVAADAHAALLQRAVDAARPARLFHGHLHERYDVTVDPTPWGGTCLVTALTDQSDWTGNTVLVDLERP